MPIMPNTTIFIKTFQRPGCLLRLLESLSNLPLVKWGIAEICIVDDTPIPYAECLSKNYTKIPIRVFTENELIGLSAGRNRMLKTCSTKYFLLLDDDFELTVNSNIDYHRQLLEESGVDILGGILYDIPQDRLVRWKQFVKFGATLRWKRVMESERLFRHGRLRLFEGWYCQIGDVVISRPIRYEPPFTRCDFVLNYFIAKTDSVLAMGGWDEDFRMGEHEDFFLRCRSHGLKVATTHEVSARHHPERTVAYSQDREELAIACQRQLLDRHGLKAFIRQQEHKDEHLIDPSLRYECS